MLVILYRLLLQYQYKYFIPDVLFNTVVLHYYSSEIVYCTVLCCTVVLYCTVLYCCTAWYWTTTVLYCY